MRFVLVRKRYVKMTTSHTHKQHVIQLNLSDKIQEQHRVYGNRDVHKHQHHHHTNITHARAQSDKQVR